MAKMNLKYPIYTDQCELMNVPLEQRRAFSCAFHFARLAGRVLKKIPEQIVYEGDTDKSVNLRHIMNSTLLLYGYRYADEPMAWMDTVRRCASINRWHWDPRFDAWLDSAGKSYNIVTREEGRSNIQ